MRRFRSSANISFSLSLEGFEEVNDGRRGEGIFDKVLAAMDLMKKHGLLFGTSICYTRANLETVTSDEFLDRFDRARMPLQLVFPLHAGRHGRCTGADADG